MHPISRSLGGCESWNSTQRRRDPLREEGPQGERSGPREQLTQTVLTTGWKTDQRGQWSQDHHARAYFRSPRRRWWWPGWWQWEQGSDQKGNSEIEAGGEKRGLDHASNTSTLLCLLRSRSICSVNPPGGNLTEKERLTVPMSVELWYWCSHKDICKFYFFAIYFSFILCLLYLFLTF